MQELEVASVGAVWIELNSLIDALGGPLKTYRHRHAHTFPAKGKADDMHEQGKIKKFI